MSRTGSVNAFNQNRSNENNWMVPPPTLIPKVIKKKLREKASITLVVPNWKASPYCPLVFEGASYSTVNSAIYAIKWMNKIRSHLDPTENSCVKSLPRILQNDNWEASGKKRSRRQ